MVSDQMSPPQMMIYFTFSAILLTYVLISHAVLSFLVFLVHPFINYTAIYDVITDVYLYTFLSETWSDLV